MNSNNKISASVNSPFWSSKLKINSDVAIFHQWDQLEASGCIDNFRLVYDGGIVSFRRGWFFADSDAYKWLDAASRIYSQNPMQKLKDLMDEFVGILSRAQSEDGYIYTYNQFHFPEVRWHNLLIEHELYCIGHLIQAGISHYQSTRENTALVIARKAADLIVKDFFSDPSLSPDGHEEIEIALLELFQETNHLPYRDLATSLLERRGKFPIWLNVLKQNSVAEARKKKVDKNYKVHFANHPTTREYRGPENNFFFSPPFSKLRWSISALTGKYFQMHSPIRKIKVPVGHAVRFGYLETAIAMLARAGKDWTLMPAIEKAWKRMVSRRMYITGGIGSLPFSEGFGNDFELDSKYAYAETCATLGCIFWNWEMNQLTGEAKYSDLLEWQLYNAAAVGMGINGNTYFYNNPLECHGEIKRKPWFDVPCCPSNISRTWASIGNYIGSKSGEAISIHQYIGSLLYFGEDLKVKMDSEFPWSGNVKITMLMNNSRTFPISLRIPSWTNSASIKINQDFETVLFEKNLESEYQQFDPSRSWYYSIHQKWNPGDTLEIKFPFPIRFLRADSRVKNLKGYTAITRGPIVYCLENIDNPLIDIFSSQIDVKSMKYNFADNILGGISIISGKTVEGKEVIAIPYHLWGNRGESQMSVWVKI